MLKEVGTWSDKILLYDTIQFYVRINKKDIKFRTEELAIEWACRSNKTEGKVIATTVKKFIHIEYHDKKITKREVKEIEKSKLIFEIYLKFGYISKSGVRI